MFTFKTKTGLLSDWLRVRLSSHEGLLPKYGKEEEGEMKQNETKTGKNQFFQRKDDETQQREKEETKRIK